MRRNRLFLVAGLFLAAGLSATPAAAMAKKHQPTDPSDSFYQFRGFDPEPAYSLKERVSQLEETGLGTASEFFYNHRKKIGKFKFDDMGDLRQVGELAFTIRACNLYEKGKLRALLAKLRAQVAFEKRPHDGSLTGPDGPAGAGCYLNVRPIASQITIETLERLIRFRPASPTGTGEGATPSGRVASNQDKQLGPSSATGADGGSNDSGRSQASGAR